MIKNEAKITNDVEVNINRAAIEHRATWMGLIFDELRKDGNKVCMIRKNEAKTEAQYEEYAAASQLSDIVYI